MIRYFGVLIFLSQQVTGNKTICKENLVIITGVNMTSKQAFHLPKSTGNTQEAVAPSRHDWKIVDWDVKP